MTGRRSALLVVAVLASLVGVVAAPQPAGALVPVQMTGASHLQVGGQRIDLGAAACPAPTPTIDLDPVSGSLDVTDIRARDRFVSGSSAYIVDVVGVVAYGYPGSYSGSGPTAISNVGVGLHLDIYAASGAGCTAGSLRCSAATVLDLSGTYTGNLAAPVPTDDLSLTGGDVTGGLQPDPACNSMTHLLGVPVTADIQGSGATQNRMAISSFSYNGPPGVTPTALCGSSDSAILGLAPTGSTWVVDVTAFALEEHIIIAGVDYEVSATISASPHAGTIGAASGYAVTQDLELETTISSGSLSTCTYSTVVCEIVDTFTGLTGALSGSITGGTIAGGSTWSVTGAGSRTIKPGCSLPVPSTSSLVLDLVA